MIDDLNLVRQIQTGDEAALAVLYRRYADPLFAFIYHHLAETRPDAEEIWQDTWLAALRSLPAYRGDSRLFTWLCGIARHKIADYYRRGGRRPAEPLSQLPPAELAALIDQGPLPEELLLRRATRIQVVEALAGLPDDYRAVLLARYADEQSVGEVARQIGKSYKATESLLARARVAFRVILGQAEGEKLHGR